MPWPRSPICHLCPGCDAKTRGMSRPLPRTSDAGCEIRPGDRELVPQRVHAKGWRRAMRSSAKATDSRVSRQVRTMASSTSMKVPAAAVDHSTLQVPSGSLGRRSCRSSSSRKACPTFSAFTSSILGRSDSGCWCPIRTPCASPTSWSVV